MKFTILSLPYVWSEGFLNSNCNCSCSCSTIFHSLYLFSLLAIKDKEWPLLLLLLLLSLEYQLSKSLIYIETIAGLMPNFLQFWDTSLTK